MRGIVVLTTTMTFPCMVRQGVGLRAAGAREQLSRPRRCRHVLLSQVFSSLYL
jgi:hypothetical protein